MTRSRRFTLAAFALAWATIIPPLASPAHATAGEHEGPSVQVAVEERIFVGRATLRFWQALLLPEFECPGYAPWVNTARGRQSISMPAGIEAGSGDIRGHVNYFSYRTREGLVTGWDALATNSITNWNLDPQNVAVYVHCTSDIAKAWPNL